QDAEQPDGRLPHPGDAGPEHRRDEDRQDRGGPPRDLLAGPQDASMMLRSCGDAVIEVIFLALRGGLTDTTTHLNGCVMRIGTGRKHRRYRRITATHAPGRIRREGPLDRLGLAVVLEDVVPSRTAGPIATTPLRACVHCVISHIWPWGATRWRLEDS